MSITKFEFADMANESMSSGNSASAKGFTLINGGIYVGIGGSTIGVTGGSDGLTFSIGGGVSIGPTVSGSATFTYKDGQWTPGGQFGYGIGTPTGLPSSLLKVDRPLIANI